MGPVRFAILSLFSHTDHSFGFVAIEEGSSIDPAINKARLVGYDLVKTLGGPDLLQD